MNKMKETLAAMKNRRGKETIILFHHGNQIEAYEQDAATVAQTLGLTPFEQDGIQTTRFPETELETNMNRLLDAGYATCFSETRDKNGNYITDYAHE
ncbi:MAG: hypothetical protein RR471_08025 [Bacteroides sp.]